VGKYIISQSKLKGQITIPSSKSHTLRAVLFGALGKGKTVISHPLASPDTEAMCKACALLGAQIDILPDEIQIVGTNGTISHAMDVIDAGNSGLVLRLCAAVGALGKRPIVITGDHSIRHHRSMSSLLNGLSQLGASAISMRGDGYPPVIIQGPLHPGKAEISGEDSQPVSALLIAASFVDGPTDLFVNNPGEKPWVGLTLDWLTRLGISHTNQHFQHYSLKGKASYEGFHYKVPGDWSSAAFPIAAALVTQSELLVHNIDIHESQGDKKIITVLEQMGACFEIDASKKTVRVKKTSTLSGIAIDINDFIDAVPILAVVACFAEGKTTIYNGAIAKQKECDRLHAITKELKKMGAAIEENHDGLVIRRSDLKGAQLFSHDDHRMAMSLTVAGLGAHSPSTLDATDCVAKTYKTFAGDLKSIGAFLEAFS
jgi:3-phosphoshikimate 1-carboxyvinyltransferase